MINILQVDKRCPVMTKILHSVFSSHKDNTSHLFKGRKQKKTYISKWDRIKYFKHVRWSLLNKPRGRYNYLLQIRKLKYREVMQFLQGQVSSSCVAGVWTRSSGGNGIPEPTLPKAAWSCWLRGRNWPGLAFCVHTQHPFVSLIRISMFFWRGGDWMTCLPSESHNQSSQELFPWVTFSWCHFIWMWFGPTSDQVSGMLQPQNCTAAPGGTLN